MGWRSDAGAFAEEISRGASVDGWGAAIVAGFLAGSGQGGESRVVAWTGIERDPQDGGALYSKKEKSVSSSGGVEALPHLRQDFESCGVFKHPDGNLPQGHVPVLL